MKADESGLQEYTNAPLGVSFHSLKYVTFEVFILERQGSAMLIIHPSDASATYSHYLREILTVEGFSDIHTTSIDQVTAARLRTHNMVFVVRMAVSRAFRELCETYVREGGNLVVFQPDDAFARTLGIVPKHRILMGATMYVPTPPAGSEPAPIHIPAAIWHAGTSTVHASLSNGTVTAPAILQHTLGKGTVLAYAFEFAQTIARTRHGDPALAGMNSGGLDGVYRPSELFVHQLDPNRSKVPVADLLTAHFALLLEDIVPTARIWYYPCPQHTSALIMTSDDDWSSPADFRIMIDSMARHHVHCTFFLVAKSQITPAALPAWEAAGHSFSVHPTHPEDIGIGLAPDVPTTEYAGMITDSLARHQRMFGTPVRTIRNHAVRWQGYVEAARELATHGVRMDFNYLPVAPFFWALCGSGRPMRFVDADGSVLDMYQQPTSWTEECLIHPEFVFSFKWTMGLAIAVTNEYIDAAATRYYSPVTINSHPVSFASYSGPLIEAHWQAAQRNHMPIMSANEWLDWTVAREQVTVAWSGNDLRVTANSPVEEVTILLPKDAQPTGPIHRVTRWGRSYQAVTLHLAQGESRVIATRL